MNEIVAALLLITFCLFTLKMVKSIKIEVTISPTKITFPGVQVKIEQPPVQFVDVEALNAAHLKEEQQTATKDTTKPAVAAFNDFMFGIEEAMTNDR